MNSMKHMWSASLCALAISTAYAADPATCQTVHFADVGWTDIAATTGLASTVLEGLGYKPTKTIASVPITFAGVKSKQIDVFLGYWSPTMDPMIDSFKKAGQVKVLATPNLTGAKYTLAVPDYVYNAGLKSFSDIAKNYDKLDGKIYGIEPGNDGNALIKKMIDTNQYGLGKFKLVESSEAGMLVEVGRAIRDKKPIVFLGWEPHPMNVQMKIDYLSGGDDVFGPNYGEAKVLTVTPTDYRGALPERREARVEPAVHDRHREPRDGADHEQDRREQGRERMAEGEPGCARQVARGREDVRWQGWVARGEGLRGGEIAAHWRLTEQRPGDGRHVVAVAQQNDCRSFVIQLR